MSSKLLLRKRSRSVSDAAARALSELRKIFEPSAYIGDYYPPIADVPALREIASQIAEAFNHTGTVNITDLSNPKILSHELLENVSIFVFISYVARILLEAFPQGDAEILDVGGGPTIYQHIGLSLSASHITHSEFSRTNRDAVVQWLKDEVGAHNWDNYFELVRGIMLDDTLFMKCLESEKKHSNSLIKNRASLIEKLLTADSVGPLKIHVRNCISEDVVHSDIFHPELALETSKVFDVVTAHFVIESASKMHTEWEKGMYHLLKRVRPGGYVIMTSIKNAAWYKVGNRSIPAAPINESHIVNALEANDIECERLLTLEGSRGDHVGYSGMIFVIGRKRVNVTQAL